MGTRCLLMAASRQVFEGEGYERETSCRLYRRGPDGPWHGQKHPEGRIRSGHQGQPQPRTRGQPRWHGRNRSGDRPRDGRTMRHHPPLPVQFATGRGDHPGPRRYPCRGARGADRGGHNHRRSNLDHGAGRRDGSAGRTHGGRTAGPDTERSRRGDAGRDGWCLGRSLCPGQTGDRMLDRVDQSYRPRGLGPQDEADHEFHVYVLCLGLCRSAQHRCEIRPDPAIGSGCHGTVPHGLRILRHVLLGRRGR